MRPGLRRDAPTDLSDLAEHPALAARIRETIRAAGPMPFDQFMEHALYDPEGGTTGRPTRGPVAAATS